MRYMRESEVRAALLQRLAQQHADEPNTLVVEELGLCQAEARVDVAVVNGRLEGWEIKTVADSLSRLPRQEQVYSRVFDRVWLVADAKHVPGAMELVPQWWGVLRIEEQSGACAFRQVRRSRLNPTVDLASLVRLLWREEVLAELEALGAADGLARAPRRVLWEALAVAVPEQCSQSHLQARVREVLRARTGWRVDGPRRSDGGSS
jgi:hypothetical protein